MVHDAYAAYDYKGHECDAIESVSDHVDAVFALFSTIVTASSGGTMLVAAGVVQLLVSFSFCTHVSRCVNLLDNILYSSPASLTTFTASNGVNLYVDRISTDIHACLKAAQNLDLSVITPRTPLDPASSPEFRELASRVPILRATLKLIFHTMQTSGTVDGMRHLIDSSLPKSIQLIFENAKLFGFLSVFGLAINIMSTFIHNEPTTLSILQESGITRAFLSAARGDLPASAEVISALPNAFGAVCLNDAGLEEFKRENPLDNFFSVFTSEEHLRTLQDNEVPHLVGNSMDEFIRHHPSLKETVLTGSSR
ncbi:hypothetical protein BASA81_018288 [Batrachochytrium salamandrivorans]|nr:hypothetical protein BASA81_018288 [Batrachochytrium salamandrivorans]